MNNKEIKALISLLEDDDNEISQHVEDKIRSFGNPIIPVLEAEWEKNFNPIVQKKIEDLIHELQFEQLKANLDNWYRNQQHDLLTGMCLIASYQYPDLDPNSIRQQLEQIYYEIWLEFKSDLPAVDQIKILNGVIFNKLKFSSNTKNFHAPGNSMINVVMESKKGNPISLSVVYMLIAQRLKMPVYGVNLPNLFVLTYKSEDNQFYINPFNQGLIFSRNEIENYIQKLKLPPSPEFFEPCSNLDIMRRVLRNLTVSFEQLGDTDKKAEVSELLNLLK